VPLDRENGEKIAAAEMAGCDYVVIEPGDLFSHDIRVAYEPPTLPGKFRSRSKRKVAYRHIVDDVADEAAAHFIAEGAIADSRGLRIDEDDILVQVYPQLLKVVVLVQRMIAGKEHFAQLVYPKEGVWPPELIRALIEPAGQKMPSVH
jgi:hypothetical protein